MYKSIITTAFFLFIVCLSCQNENKSSSSINPNGDSELALLMRDMFNEGMVIKQSVINGETPQLNLNYQHISTATPSEAGKNSSHEYLLFAKAYEASIERLKNASAEDRPAAYNNMVDNCMSCHNEICPGPTVRIKKMYLSDSELKLTSR